MDESKGEETSSIDLSTPSNGDIKIVIPQSAFQQDDGKVVVIISNDTSLLPEKPIGGYNNILGEISTI